jgi:hypothetical protein
MSSSTNPEQRAHVRDSFETFLYRTSQATLVVAPALIFMPPRKLDKYTFLLTGAFVVSAAHLISERRLTNQDGGSFLTSSKAKEVHTQISRQKERDGNRRLLEEPLSSSAEADRGRGGSLLEEKAREVWMGGETEGWKERRLKEERERLAKGEGYGDMIMDQIWDVWNWGGKKAEELKETDQEVLKRQQREREFPKIGKD